MTSRGRDVEGIMERPLQPLFQLDNQASGPIAVLRASTPVAKRGSFKPRCNRIASIRVPLETCLHQYLPFLAADQAADMRSTDHHCIAIQLDMLKRLAVFHAMEFEPTDSNRATDQQHPQTPRTLAELLFPLCAPSKRSELEKYRTEFEAVHGATDLTKHYTSTWSVEKQNWLVRNDIKRYFDGLPPFVKAYLKGKMQLAARRGTLDSMPNRMLQLFVSGQMHLDHESPTR
jgi:hypothetical protein